MNEKKQKELRQLAEQERKFVQKRLDENKQELKGIMFAKHQAELMLNEGLDAERYENERKYKAHLSAVNTKQKELDFTINICTKQLNEGVEVKEAVPLPTQITVEMTCDQNYYDIVDKLEDLGLVIKNKEEKKDEA